MHVNIFQVILGVAISLNHKLVVYNMKKDFWCDGWCFHVKGVNVFHLVRFDHIKFYFNSCLKFQFSGSTFLPTLSLKLILSRRYSKEVVILETRFSWSNNFDDNSAVFLSYIWCLLRVSGFTIWGERFLF